MLFHIILRFWLRPLFLGRCHFDSFMVSLDYTGHEREHIQCARIGGRHPNSGYDCFLRHLFSNQTDTHFLLLQSAGDRFNIRHTLPQGCCHHDMNGYARSSILMPECDTTINHLTHFKSLLAEMVMRMRLADGAVLARRISV